MPDKERLRNITPKKIFDAAVNLSRLRTLGTNPRVENQIVDGIHANMPTRKDWLLPSGLRMAYRLRVRVADMSNELWKDEGVHKTGPKEVDVRFVGFHRGDPEKPACQDANAWYLEVIDPRMGWSLHIKVEDLQAANHWGIPLASTN